MVLNYTTLCKKWMISIFTLAIVLTVFGNSAFAQEESGNATMISMPTITKDMVNFNGEFAISIGADKVNNYYLVDMSQFASLFEKVYFLNDVYQDSVLVCNLSDLNSVVLAFSAGKNYEIGFIKARFANLKAKAHQVSFTMTAEEKNEYVKQSNKLFQLSKSPLYPENINQNNLCDSALPFCTGTNYQFPAGVGAGSGQSGPCYNCLSTTPNPAWYYMKIANPGDLHIYMYSTPSRDIDFCCWGPFDTQSSCTQLTCAKVVDCSYSPNPTETCDIYGATTGKYYILVITNYSNQACNINFSQTSGSGSTDCTILPPPASNNGPLCVGETLILTASAVVGASYHWSGPAGFISNMQNPVIFNVSLANAGEYSLTITVNGQTSDPSTTDVAIFPGPTATLVGTTAICEGNSTDLTFNLTGTPPWTIKFSDGTNTQTIPFIGVTPYNYTVTPLVTTTYTLVSVEDSHCTGAVAGTATITVDSPIVLSNTQAECTPTNTHYIVTFEIAGGDPTTYSVTPNNGTISSGPPYIFTSDQIPESTPYEFTVTDVADCGPQSVSGSQSCVCPASAQMSGSTAICSGESATITINLNGVSPWNITYTQNGGNPQNIVANVSPYTFNVSPTATTNYAMTNVSDANCTGTVTGNANVVVNPLPTANFDATTECKGTSTEFTDGSSVVSGIVNQWSWDFGDSGTSTEQNPDHLYAAAGTYDVTLVATSNYDCLNTITKQVVVHPMPIVNAGEDQTIFYGASTTLSSTVTGGSGNYTYQWEPADSLINATVANPQTKTLRGNTDFTLTVSDQDGGCISDDVVSVLIEGFPLGGSLYAVPQEICLGAETGIYADITGGAGELSYSWRSVPAGFTSTLKDITVSPSQTTQYILAVTDEAPNTKEFPITVTVHPLPIADAGDDQTISNGAWVRLNGSATSGTGNYYYVWEPADSLATANNIAAPKTKNLSASTYFELTVFDDMGCVDKDSVLVAITGGPLSIAPIAKDSICKGETVQLHANPSGGAGDLTYSWISNPPDPSLINNTSADPVVSPQSENTTYTYSVTVTDSYNNSKTGSATVTVNPLPYINLVPSGAPHVANDTLYTCIYDSVTLDAGSGNKTYRWSNGANTQSITIKTTGIAFDIQEHTVNVTDYSHSTLCENSATIIVLFAFNECGYGIGENDNDYSIRVYPNPTKGDFTIELKGVKKSLNLQLVNASGQIISTQQLSGLNGSTFTTIYSLNSQQPGVYFMKLLNDDFVRVVKVIKK